jgi:hypothetical protein
LVLGPSLLFKDLHFVSSVWASSCWIRFPSILESGSSYDLSGNKEGVFCYLQMKITIRQDLYGAEMDQRVSLPSI